MQRNTSLTWFNSANLLSIKFNFAFRGLISASDSDLISAIVAIRKTQLKLSSLGNGSQNFQKTG